MALARIAEFCLSGVAVGKGTKATPARFPFAGGLHSVSQRFMLSSQASSSSPSLSASTLASASLNSVGFRRPDEIPWQKGLVNSITLIGVINHSVHINYLDSGKVTATTSLRVARHAQLSDSRLEAVFQLQFWDELAEIAAAHLKKEDHVYIAGSIWVESYVDKNSVVRSTCKVVAKDVKFVGDDYRVGNNAKAEGKHEEETTIGSPESRPTDLEDVWRDYFKNPEHFWDNRASKNSWNSPDFKHKSTGVALWISGKSTPSWVHSRLEVLASEQNELKGEKLRSVEKLWQQFFADPAEWWDNRQTKISQNYPDFKNRLTGQGLWIESTGLPTWVKSQLEILDSKAKCIMEGGPKRGWEKEKTPKTSFQDEDFNFL